MGTDLSLTESVCRTVALAQVTLLIGDLTALDFDAIVSYAREDLQLGSGYGTAIQTRGGDTVAKELAKIGRVEIGEAVITGGGRLKARHVIHACGPKFQEAYSERKLLQCMRSALRLASDKGLESIAFPPMGAGFYGIPLKLCSKVMLEAIKECLAAETTLRQVVICVTDGREFDAFKNEVESL